MPRRILVVDDEANIRRMIRLTLEADGHDVEDAADGAKALELFGDGSRFDAVLLDQKMPGMDGIETLRQMRRRSPDATIVMVTAFGTIDLAVDAMKAGARDFLKKPVTPALLRSALDAAMSKTSVARGTPATDRAQPSSSAIPEPTPAGPHELWTVNGFFIRSLPSADSASTLEHHFAVRHASRGAQGTVVVTIGASEAARIAKLAGRQLPPSGAFWRQQAERALMNHLFQNSALPAGDHLAVNRLSDDVALQAREWHD
jgi:DNA-binding response OmpR family regulator